jgi:chorismate mutase
MVAITVEAGTDTPADGTSAPDAHIASLRARLDDIDATIIRLWQERAAISQEVGRTRVAAGGTRLVLAREREILERFGAALGEDGVQLALLILRAGRGKL